MCPVDHFGKSFLYIQFFVLHVFIGGFMLNLVESADSDKKVGKSILAAVWQLFSSL